MRFQASNAWAAYTLKIKIDQSDEGRLRAYASSLTEVRPLHPCRRARPPAPSQYTNVAFVITPALAACAPDDRAGASGTRPRHRASSAHPQVYRCHEIRIQQQGAGAFPVSSEQFLKLVHFLPMIPASAKYLNLGSFLSKPAAQDFLFLQVALPLIPSLESRDWHIGPPHKHDDSHQAQSPPQQQPPAQSPPQQLPPAQPQPQQQPPAQPQPQPQPPAQP